MSAQTVKSMADQRVRRQKIFIAVGSVALLAILGFELPKVLGGKGGDSALPAVTAAVPAVGTPAALPVAKLPNTDRVVVVRDSSQLISFGLFKSKDPFVQQLTSSSPGAASSPVAPPVASKPKPSPVPSNRPAISPVAPQVAPASGVVTPAPSSPAATPAPASTTPGPTSTTTPVVPPQAPADALLAVNGVCERIAVKATFPTNENIFRLVSIARSGKSVEIGVVGGSFDSGKPTATLKMGEKLTLVNTADGTRYVIELKSSCTLAPPASSTPSITTQATPVPPAPPVPTTTTSTTTTTTPIVTDSLDTTTPSP